MKAAGGARWRCCRMRWHMAGRFFSFGGGGRVGAVAACAGEGQLHVLLLNVLPLLRLN